MLHSALPALLTRALCALALWPIPRGDACPSGWACRWGA